MAHADRLETITSIEQGYATADAVDRELQALGASKACDSDEAKRFVWAAQEERAALARVISDQKAHAVAAAETINRLHSLRAEEEEHARAVRAAAQLRSGEFQVARWWAGVQHGLALASAQRHAAEAALSAEHLEDRRVWKAHLLAARAAGAMLGADLGGSAETESGEGRAAAARRDANAAASITARIYDQLLANRPSVVAEATASALLDAAIAQQLALLGAGATAEGQQEQLAVDSVLEPLRAAAVLPITESTSDWRRLRAMYAMPEQPSAPPHLEPEPEPEIVVGVVLPPPIDLEPEPEPEPEFIPMPLALPAAHEELDWPLEYMDPISLEPMLDPVRLKPRQPFLAAVFHYVCHEPVLAKQTDLFQI